jgi:hypothetical protein
MSYLAGASRLLWQGVTQDSAPLYVIDAMTGVVSAMVKNMCEERIYFSHLLTCHAFGHHNRITWVSMR